MKYFKLIVLLFFSHFVFSQNLESLKKLDTIYVYFSYSKYEHKTDYSKIEKVNEFWKEVKRYIFELDTSNSVIFNYNKYKDFDSYFKNIITDVKIVKKSFLRKNKDKIIDVNFFLKYGFKEMFFLLYGKTIYIIDKNEIVKNKITLKQVWVMSDYIEE